MLRWMMFLLAGCSAWAMDYEGEPGVVGSPATVEKMEGASGGAILRFTGSDLKNPAAVDLARPDKVISFTADRTGAWKISATVCAEHSGNDSVYYRVDDGPLQELHVGYPRKLFSKVMGSFDLEQGVHKLAFYRREPGFGLDKISMAWTPREPKMVTFPGKPGPDAVYTVKANPGNYYLRIFASVPEAGPQYNATITIGDQQPVVRRIIFPTVASGRYEVERVAVKSAPVQIRIQTDKAVTISHIRLEPVRKILPEAAANYVPPIKPRADRPRVWINRESLEIIKKNIAASAPHRKAWQTIADSARKPFKFAPVPGREVQWDHHLVSAMRDKALYFLVTGDKKIGREACELAVAYFKVVNFGNGQDICRRTGEAIRVASMVYDWCYDVMTPAERRILRDRFFWLAESMEIGWPPFLQNINTGHGNEAQLNKDLLTMAIAIYDEDPVPWQYCAYRLLEEARPIKNHLYRSGFHYEGIAYGNVRYDADMTAAFLLKKATGFDQYEPYAGKVPYAWFHLRTPDGDLFRNGDDYMRNTYAGSADIYLVANALWPDPKLKSGYQEYCRPGHAYTDAFMYLLMMPDADQKADDRRDDLPKVKYFGEPLSILTARTGWEYGFESEDVLMQMIGAAIHNASHQHHDAGSFQLYYRGMLVSDIGQYRYYGKPYDWNFAKSSMSHSVMRLVDPQQKKIRWDRHKAMIPAGMQEVPPVGPQYLDDILQKREYYTQGTVLNVSTDTAAPYLQVELSPSYPGRCKRYVRTMVFLAAENPALVVFDELDLPRPDIKPVWQLTTFDKPELRNGQLVAGHSRMGREARLTVTPLLPRKQDVKILSGKDAHTVLGVLYPAPYPNHPGASGSRTEITAAAGESTARFLHVLQPTPGTDAAPVKMQEKDGVITLVSDGWQLILAPGKAPAATVTKPRKSATVPHDMLYLNGKEQGKLTNGKYPLIWLLNACNIPWEEKNGVLTVDGITVLDRNADGPADAARVSKVNGMWMVTPDEAAGFVNAKIVKTRWSSNCFLITRPHKARWLSCTVEPGKSHLADWRTLLDDEEGSFIADGKTVCTAAFRTPQKLAGVSLRYLYGDMRSDRLKIEVSADGKNFKTVFDGRTSGKTSGFQDFKFPAQMVHTLRFSFLGNSVNTWNNLSGLRVIYAR